MTDDRIMEIINDSHNRVREFFRQREGENKIAENYILNPLEELKQQLQESVPAETLVSFAAPNQQLLLFTITEVKEFLQEQRRLCAIQSQGHPIEFNSTAIFNTPEPQKFIDRIIIKS